VLIHNLQPRNNQGKCEKPLNGRQDKNVAKMAFWSRSWRKRRKSAASVENGYHGGSLLAKMAKHHNCPPAHPFSDKIRSNANGESANVVKAYAISAARVFSCCFRSFFGGSHKVGGLPEVARLRLCSVAVATPPAGSCPSALLRVRGLPSFRRSRRFASQRLAVASRLAAFSPASPLCRGGARKTGLRSASEYACLSEPCSAVVRWS